MILALLVCDHWLTNLLIDTENGSYKSSFLPLSFYSFYNKYSKEELINVALSTFGFPKGEIKTYLVSATSKLVGDASYKEVLSKLSNVGSFIWFGDKEAISLDNASPQNISNDDFFNEFYLEQNRQVAENLWQNRQIFGARVPFNDYEISLETAAISASIKTGVGHCYDKVFKNFEKIIVSGSYPFIIDNPLKVVWSLLNSINYAGVWEIVLDSKAQLPVLAIVNFFENAKYLDFASKLKFSATVAIAIIPGVKLISVTFPEGAAQEFDLSDGKPLFLPIEEGSQIAIKFKAKKEVVQSVTGAQMGVLIDGRPRPLHTSVSKMQQSREFEEISKAVLTKI